MKFNRIFQVYKNIKNNREQEEWYRKWRTIISTGKHVHKNTHYLTWKGLIKQKLKEWSSRLRERGRERRMKSQMFVKTSTIASETLYQLRSSTLESKESYIIECRASWFLYTYNTYITFWGNLKYHIIVCMSITLFSTVTVKHNGYVLQKG